MSIVPKYYVKVLYNGVDISTDITSHLIALRYVDQVHGQSDEIEIQLEDGDAKWRNEWYPKKSDFLSVTIGPDKQSSFECGTFWIDEIESSGPPDVISIRGLATGGGALNTRKSSAHEGKSLKDIATAIAKNNGLTIDDGGWVKSTNTNYDLKDEAKKILAHSKLLSSLSTQNNSVVKISLERLQGELTTIRLSIESKEALKHSDQVKRLQQSVTALYLFVGGLETDDYHGQRNILINEQAGFAANLSTTFFQVSGVLHKTNVKAGSLDGIVIDRSTQNHESDLAFLKRLCDEFGIIFNIRGTIMFFTTVFKLEEISSSFSISRQQLKAYSFKDKIQRVFKKAKVKYHNPKDKKIVESDYDNPELTNADGATYKQETSEDTLVIHKKTENKEQAQIKAQAALHKANSHAKEGSISLEGNRETVLILAGNNFDLVGNGMLSGKYHVISSTHELSKSNGYEISADIKAVGTVEKLRMKEIPLSKTRKTQTA